MRCFTGTISSKRVGSFTRAASTTFLAAALLVGAHPIAALGHTRPAGVCEETVLNQEGTYLGEFTLMGNGTVRSWVKLDKAGKPTAMGVTMSEGALEGLPDGPLSGSMPGMISVEHPLALPPQAAAAGYDHISLDWDPKGHPPPGIYDVPHFDIHFYQMTPKQLDRITAMGKDVPVCEKPIPAKYRPAGYILPPETEFPRMGAHWVDTAAPELHHQPFTRTFIYGSYDGKLTFLEPMVTRAFLETHPNVTDSVKQPQAFLRPGYYPTRYSIHYDPVRKEITIAIEGLTRRGRGSV